MKKQNLKCLAILIAIIICNKSYSQALGCPNCPPADVPPSWGVYSDPCIPEATPWVLGGNNLNVPAGPYSYPTSQYNIGTCNDFPFILKAKNNPAVFILQSGNVGIGSQGPNSKLVVEDPTIAEVVAYASGAAQASGFWAKNNISSVTSSYGFRNDNSGVGHISSDQVNPNNLLNFQWDPSNSIPQVWIGTKKPDNIHSDFKFGVEGKLVAQSVYVQINHWSDNVFNNDYRLPKLGDIETYYKLNKHLPEIPNEKEVLNNGIDLGEMNGLLLKKVEELTLYLVDQMHKYDKLKEELEQVKIKLNEKK